MSEKQAVLNIVHDAERHEPSLMEIIREVAARPGLESVEVLERLVALKERADTREAEKSFARDLVDLQSEIPQIEERGKIMNKGGQSVRSTYAKWEDVDAVVRSLMHKYGFSFGWNEEDAQGNMRKFSATLLHRDGHSRTLYKTMPFDRSEFRTEAQSESSTTSLARRQLTRMHLNIVTKGADDDGQGSGVKPITEEQARDIETLLKDTKSDVKKFLELIAGVGSVREILSRDYRRCINSLETKQRAQK